MTPFAIEPAGSNSNHKTSKPDPFGLPQNLKARPLQFAPKPDPFSLPPSVCPKARPLLWGYSSRGISFFGFGYIQWVELKVMGLIFRVF